MGGCEFFVYFCSLGLLWAALGARLGALGAFLSTLGTLLEPLGALLGGLWRLLAALGAVWGHPWEALGAILALSCKKCVPRVKGITFLASNLGGKMLPKSSKIDVERQHAFEHLFVTSFFNLSSIFWIQISMVFRSIFGLEAKTSIL